MNSFGISKFLKCDGGYILKITTPTPKIFL
jgi:hypothetical protein